MKKGRLSKSEQLYIKQHHVSKPVDDIAAHLDRDPTSIAKYIETTRTANTERKIWI